MPASDFINALLRLGYSRGCALQMAEEVELDDRPGMIAHLSEEPGSNNWH